MHKGHIISSEKDRYEVLLEDGRILACMGRGVFRDKKQTPYVGDYVRVEVHGEEGRIVELLPRRNLLLRPPVANVDQVLLVQTIVEPEINSLALDKILLMIERRKLPILIAFNKRDRLDEKKMESWRKAYQAADYPVFFTDSRSGEGIKALQKSLHGKITAVAGPSGAGKSTMIRRLTGNPDIVIGELSQKTARGKQTTRKISLFALEEESFLFDTPGFSSLDLSEISSPAELASLFPEIRAVSPFCRFRNCSHIKEPNCAVRQAVKEGKMAQSRYQSYETLLKELENKKNY